MLEAVVGPRIRIGFYALVTLACLLAFGWLAADVRASSAGAFDAASVRVASIARALERREVLLRAEGESFAIPWSALGYHVDREQTLRRLLALEPSKSRLESAWERAMQFAAQPSEPGPELDVVWRFDAATARAHLQQWAPGLRVDAQDAAVDFALHVRVAERPGRELDVEATVARAAVLSPPFDDQLELSFHEIEPRVRLSALSSIDPRKVLARYDTDFSKKRGPRIHNIKTAAAYLDGRVLGPGETLSFNRTVGKRVAERGFVDAPVIVNDVMESGMGGGVCQVATALHAAAVFGGLNIVERRSHSRPTGYAPLGLDAVVLDDVQDLRLRNPYETPIYVRAYLPSRYVLRVELLGVERPGTVKHDFWVAKRYDYTRRVVVKAELPSGTFKQVQKGGYGYDTVSTITHVKPDGQREAYRYKSKYYPVPEVLWVGPGTNPKSLPPLPDGAMTPTETGDVLGI